MTLSRAFYKLEITDHQWSTSTGFKAYRECHLTVFSQTIATDRRDRRRASSTTANATRSPTQQKPDMKWGTTAIALELLYMPVKDFLTFTSQTVSLEYRLEVKSDPKGPARLT